MATFRAKDFDWILSLDAPTIQTVRADTCGVDDCRHRPHKDKCEGVDLADEDGRAFDRMAGDPVLFFQVLWILCREQAEQRNISMTHFAQAVAGDAGEEAATTLHKARLDFFPSRKRKLIQAVADKNAKVRELGTAKALQRIESPELEAKLVAAMEANIDAEIDRVLTRLNSANATPDSAESTPVG